MDQGPLVSDLIRAGAKLAEDFDHYAPLKAVFWLKLADDEKWFLYLISDQINDGNFGAAYGEVGRILREKPQFWLDSMQVKVAGVGNKIAAEVIELQKQYPDPRKWGFRFGPCMVGGRYVREAYVYPLPVASPV